MQFALNYSPQAALLRNSGRIEVDRFKCPEWPELVATVQKETPCYVHFAFRAGRDFVEAADWETVERLLDVTRTPYVNIHLAPCANDFRGMSVTTTDPAHRARLIDAMERDVNRVAERFALDRVIVENVMWDPDSPWCIPQPALESAVIRQVVRDTGCGFVLDVTHARICALHFGVDAQRYIDELPTDRLREMHISGTRVDEQGLWQDHFPMTDEDWALADWALARIGKGDWPRPWITAFEYGGVGPGYEARTDATVLAQQVPRLFDRVKSAGAG